MPFSFLLAIVLGGCSSDSFTSGHGNVGQFILLQSVVRGGNPATNSLPVISGRWRYSEDTNGVIIQMSLKQYPAVEAFLRQAFGEPRMGPAKTSNGGELGVYRLSSKGGAIQFGYGAKQTQIIIIRPMTMDEVLQGIAKTPDGSQR